MPTALWTRTSALVRLPLPRQGEDRRAESSPRKQFCGRIAARLDDCFCASAGAAPVTASATRGRRVSAVAADCLDGNRSAGVALARGLWRD